MHVVPVNARSALNTSFMGGVVEQPDRFACRPIHIDQRPPNLFIDG